MSGSIGILNVGAGDTKLTFDKSNPAECIRAARIVKDMLRRGYALLVEVEMPQKDGGVIKGYQRVLDFKEDTCEYVIADFDPVTAEQADKEEVAHGAASEPKATAPNDAKGDGKRPGRRGPRGRGRLAVAATGAKGIAVARSAGG